MRRGDLGEAEKEIREAIKIAPESELGLYHWTYGEILEEKNDIPGAIKETEESIRLYREVPQFDGNDETEDDFEENKQRLKKLRAKLETSTQ